MLAWLKKNWLPAAVAAGVGALGLALYEKHALAAKTAKTSTLPSTATVNLQPGSTTVAVAKGGSVVLVLPQGATWAGSNPISPLAPTGVQPTGNESMNIVMSSTQTGIFPITAMWIDSSSNQQSTTINVSVS